MWQAESVGLVGETAREGLFLVLEPASIRAMNIKKLSDLVEGTRDACMWELD